MRVATFNMLHEGKGHHAPQARADAREVSAAADLIGWQEAHDWLGILDTLGGFETYWHGPRAASQNPISYRPDVLTLNRGHVVYAGDTGKGANPGPRWITVCEFTHRPTGQPVVVLNTHLNSHIEQAGHPRDLPRARHAIRHIAQVRDLIDHYRDDALVIVLGDFNIDHPADQRVQAKGFPVDVLGPVVQFDLPAHANTLGRRDIDYVLHTPEPFVEVTERRVIGGLDSDHDAVVVTYAIDQPTVEEEHAMKFVSRDEWGATRKRPTRATHPIGSTKGITAHWEGPGMGGFDHSVCARKVRTIERFHEVNRGWSGIAYNAIVCPHGYVFEGRGPGVKSAANGYTSVNEDWYAVCYLGGKGDSFTEAGKRGFLDAFDWLTREGDAGPARNGHRDHKPTACPGDDIYAWVHSGLPTPTEEDDDMPSPKEIADAIWNADVADYDGPESRVRRARVILSQAHNRAGDARANAHAALAQANRNRDAIEALGKALDGLAPGVADQVLEALGERIEVSLTVNTDQE